jgi:PAS domain S-box-containing protein
MDPQDARTKSAINPSADSAASPEEDSGQALRRRAEALADERAGKMQANVKVLSPEAAQSALHELRVHQIELEMQNQELRRIQEELEISRERYFDLYNLAPVGYFTINDKGLILEANLTAAKLLGMARGSLAMQPLSRFVLREDQDSYYLHRKALVETGAPQGWDLRMLRRDAPPFWVRVEATTAR